MKKPAKVFVFLTAFIVVVVAALALFVRTIDADKYRPQLVDTLSKKTGRAVRMDGPIAFSLGFGGVHVSIRDVSIANPSWASRPVMAGMGKFELGVGLLPLLGHRVSINDLTIENADILLETNASGQHNWDMGDGGKTASSDETAQPVAASTTAPTSTSASSASLSVGGLSIVNSRLALRSAEGKTSSIDVASLALGMRGTGAELKVKANVNGAPLIAVVKTSVMDLLSREPFSFDADVTFNAIHFAAQGKADLGSSKADISAYELTAAQTKVTGDVTAQWGGVRPFLRGTLNSDHLRLGDFKLAANETAAEAAKAPAAAPVAAHKPLFSTDPLPLAALKAADADLTVAVGEFPLGTSALKQVSAKLVLSGGNLVLAPVKAVIGTAPVEVQVKLNASQTPAHLALGLMASAVDLGDLQRLGDMSPFMTGKAGAEIQLVGDGTSAHEIASSLGGVITVTAEKGEILSGAASDVSSFLGTMLSAKGSDNALNCLAARFVAKNGVLNDNGLLLDSAASTVAGAGNVNLGAETVNLTLRAKTKLVDIGGLVPVLQVKGPLASPDYSVDAAGVVKNVVGSLMNGNIDVISSSVPEIQTATGQNACVYTLNHPKKAASQGALTTNSVGQVGDKIKNIGNSLVKGLFGQ